MQDFNVLCGENIACRAITFFFFLWVEQTFQGGRLRQQHFQQDKPPPSKFHYKIRVGIAFAYISNKQRFPQIKTWNLGSTEWQASKLKAQLLKTSHVYCLLRLLQHKTLSFSVLHHSLLLTGRYSALKILIPQTSLPSVVMLLVI